MATTTTSAPPANPATPFYGPPPDDQQLMRRRIDGDMDKLKQNVFHLEKEAAKLKSHGAALASIVELQARHAEDILQMIQLAYAGATGGNSHDSTARLTVLSNELPRLNHAIEIEVNVAHSAEASATVESDTQHAVIASNIEHEDQKKKTSEILKDMWDRMHKKPEAKATGIVMVNVPAHIVFGRAKVQMGAPGAYAWSNVDYAAQPLAGPIPRAHMAKAKSCSSHRIPPTASANKHAAQPAADIKINVAKLDSALAKLASTSPGFAQALHLFAEKQMQLIAANDMHKPPSVKSTEWMGQAQKEMASLAENWDLDPLTPDSIDSALATPFLDAKLTELAA